MATPTPLQLLELRHAIIGEDTPVARALPQRQRRTVGAWCFLDHAGPVQFAAGEGMHVGAHPHIGLQTFTWMIEGEVVHRDSLGNEQLIRTGEVNLMTAGRGIVHTEDSAHPGARLHAAQLWIALPDTQRHCAPAFVHHAELPRTESGGFVLSVLVGSALGLHAPTAVHTPLLGLDLTATTAAATVLPLNSDFEHAVLLLQGEALLDGQALPASQWAYLPPGRSELALQCKASAHLLLIGGQPFAETPLLWWNFVARNQAEIETALADWNAGRFAPVRPGSPAAPLSAPSLEGARLKPAFKT